MVQKNVLYLKLLGDMCSDRKMSRITDEQIERLRKSYKFSTNLLVIFKEHCESGLFR